MLRPRIPTAIAVTWGEGSVLASRQREMASMAGIWMAASRATAREGHLLDLVTACWSARWKDGDGLLERARTAVEKTRCRSRGCIAEPGRPSISATAETISATAGSPISPGRARILAMIAWVSPALTAFLNSRSAAGNEREVRSKMPRSENHPLIGRLAASKPSASTHVGAIYDHRNGRVR